MSVPATRSLAAVLRELTGGADALTLVVGIYGAALADPEGRTYANVVLGGETVRAPKLAGASHGAEGQPAYILAAPGRMLVLGTVSN